MKVFLFICWCLGIYLRKLVFSLPCASTKSLSVQEGDDIILQLDLKNVPLTSVTWDYEQYIIATTKPGRPVEMGDHSSGYTGRLSSNVKDGSLVIRAFSSEDARIYRAELYNRENNFICAQLYDLRISGVNKGVSPSIAGPEERCDHTQQFSPRPGGDVTLPLPSRSEVTVIMWDINNSDHIAVTRPGQLERSNVTYNGRLSVMSDGSLQMSGITTNDERIFRAEVFTNNWNHYCTQNFDVKIKREMKTFVIIQLSLSACVLAAALFILIHHIRTECAADR